MKQHHNFESCLWLHGPVLTTHLDLVGSLIRPEGNPSSSLATKYSVHQRSQTACYSGHHEGGWSENQNIELKGAKMPSRAYGKLNTG